MGSRTWFKVYVDKWMNGTVRQDTLETRAVFIDLLALAASNQYGKPGVIQLAEGVGLPSTLVAQFIGCGVKKSNRIIRLLSQTDRVIVSSGGVISIVNWNKYQSEYGRLQAYTTTGKVQNKVQNKCPKSTPESTPLEGRGETENKNKKRIYKKKIERTGLNEFAPGVYLTEKEYLTLSEKFGKIITDKKITAMADYQINRRNKPYDNHYLALNNWLTDDVDKPKPPDEPMMGYTYRAADGTEVKI